MLALRKVSVQAYEDPGHPEGGHAVLLLQGVTKAPPSPVFRLKPGDAATAADAAGWPSGDLKPLGSRVTEDGLELQLGPEVTESELLLPGTLVEIEVAGADACGAFLWPNIAPMLRPKRRTVIVNGPKRKGQAAETDKDSSKADAAKDAGKDAAKAGAGKSGPVVPEATGTPEAATKSDPGLISPAVPPAVPEAGTHSTSADANSVTVGPAPATAAPSPAGEATTSARAASTETTDTPPAAPHDIAGAATAAAATLAAAAATSLEASPGGVASEPKPLSAPVPPAPAPQRTGPATSLRGAPLPDSPSGGDPRMPAPAMAPGRPQASLRGGSPLAGDPRSAAPSRAVQRPAADPGFYPHARSGQTAPAPRPTQATAQSSRRMGNLLQALIGMVAVAAAFYVLARESSRKVAPIPPSEAAIGVTVAPGERWAANAPPPASPAPASTATGPSPATPSLPVGAPRTPPGGPSPSPGPVADGLLFDALSVGALSPRGSSGAGVGAPRALENANAQLTGATRDTEEAAFWLRRYLAVALGNDRTMRALTQLGSVYAEPEGRSPDYAKARLLWEIASAAGDPVAMCFLGLLHENGLGGAPDRRAALQWYERSKQAGGCPQVDEQIARVRQ